MYCSNEREVQLERDASSGDASCWTDASPRNWAMETCIQNQLAFLQKAQKQKAAIECSQVDLEEDELNTATLIAKAELIQELMQKKDPAGLKNAYKALFSEIVVGEVDRNGRRKSEVRGILTRLLTGGKNVVLAKEWLRMRTLCAENHFEFQICQSQTTTGNHG